MGVVAAGVHFALFRRGEGKPRLLLNGQRVHVRAQAQHSARPFSLNDGREPAAPHAGLDVRRAHGLKLLRNEGRGVLCVERQFGMPVQMPPPLYKLGVQRPRLVPDDCPA